MIISQEDKIFLDKLGCLQILVDDNFSPITYYDEETAEFGGIAMDVLKVLSTILDFDYKIIRDDNLSWPDRLDKVRNDEIHILAGASRNEKREEFGVFTEAPYFTVNYAMIKLIDNYAYLSELSDIKNFRIGLSKGISINNYLQDFIKNETEIIYYNNQADALEGLKNREIDIYPYNEAVFKEDFFAGKLFDFEVALSIQDLKKNYAFFCPKTEEGFRLASILDQGMTFVDIDEIIADRYQNMSNFAFYRQHLEDMRLENSRKSIGIIILLVTLSAGLIISVIIKLESNQRGKLITELTNLQSQLKDQASYDNLTSLPNRMLFNDRLHQVLAHSKRKSSSFAVLFMDLDGFKAVNDSFGHETGDKVLIEISRRIASSMRDCDTAARLGGDEFMAIMTDITSKEQPAATSFRLIQAISEPVIVNGNVCSIGVSIGISIYPDDAKDSHILIHLADQAMYKIKNSGKNNFSFSG